MRRAAQSNEPAYVWYEAEFFREAIPSELLYGAAQHHQLAVWSSGMIRAQGARGPGLNSCQLQSLTHASMNSNLIHQRPSQRILGDSWAHKPESTITQLGARGQQPLLVNSLSFLLQPSGKKVGFWPASSDRLGARARRMYVSSYGPHVA